MELKIEIMKEKEIGMMKEKEIGTMKEKEIDIMEEKEIDIMEGKIMVEIDVNIGIMEGIEMEIGIYSRILQYKIFFCGAKPYIIINPQKINNTLVKQKLSFVKINS
jgi:hypothetical protein